MKKICESELLQQHDRKKNSETDRQTDIHHGTNTTYKHTTSIGDTDTTHHISPKLSSQQNEDNDREIKDRQRLQNMRKN